MMRRKFSGGAGLATVAILCTVLLVIQSGSDDAAIEAGQTSPEVTVSDNLISLLITVGIKDQVPTEWTGEITVTPGKVVASNLVQGNPRAKVEGGKFSAKSIQAAKKDAKKKKAANLLPPIIRLTLDAPTTAQVKVATSQGNFQFSLQDLQLAEPTLFLEGKIRVQRDDGVVRLSDTPAEEDYPALARDPDGSLWLAYSVYRHGRPYITDRVLTGNFDELVPQGNGDQLFLRRFDGKTWSAPMEATEAGLDIWRPTVAVDGQGVVHLAWAQQKESKWQVYLRRFTPGKEDKPGTWSEIVPVSPSKGSQVHVVATADAKGKVWLAWQEKQDGFFQIIIQPIGGKSQAITTARANHWCPSIAADRRGNVFIAYDTYEQGNYDVRLHIRGPLGEKTLDFANSAKYEARPSVAVDSQDRPWIAYEEGDEQWGKDFANKEFVKIGLPGNPGNPLYLKRTVRVKCLEGDQFKVPADDLQDVLARRTANNRSLPRLGVDGQGGLWLTYRHHPRPLGLGEVWNSFVTRLDGAAWSTPRPLAFSDNLLDHRPALAATKQGLVVVFAGDQRSKQMDRRQNDLYAAHLAGKAIGPMKLVADSPTLPAKLPAVHPQEAEHVARIRAYRLEHQGKQLRLFRGEFHRHTEYTAHRDGDGLLEDSWRYGLDAGRLDWMGNADHDNGHHDEYAWWQIQKTADLFHDAPNFVAVQSYERSVVYPNGHRNVMFPVRGIRPLPRGNLVGTEEKGTPDTKILYKYLAHFKAICSSHTSGTNMGTDWRDNDPVYEPVVEIYQGHRHNYEHPGAPRSPTAQNQIGGFQPKGFIWNAFDKGYKLGFQSSSDHISTHMSYGMVLTDDLSRKGIIEAFKQRHSYGATDNIILEFRCGKQIMGDIFETRLKHEFRIKALGTAPLKKISIIRDGQYIHVASPGKADVELTFTDDGAPAGKTSYYYVRLEQEDGNLAWASPMWITYRP